MYIVELAFGDEPERLTERPAHRERLQRHHADGRLVIAGPYADDSGALLLFDVASTAELDAIVDADPYYQAPGVTVVRRQEWTPIVGV
jgi:uncharacterized protein YciI